MQEYLQERFKTDMNKTRRLFISFPSTTSPLPLPLHLSPWDLLLPLWHFPYQRGAIAVCVYHFSDPIFFLIPYTSTSTSTSIQRVTEACLVVSCRCRVVILLSVVSVLAGAITHITQKANDNDKMWRELLFHAEGEPTTTKGGNCNQQDMAQKRESENGKRTKRKRKKKQGVETADNRKLRQEKEHEQSMRAHRGKTTTTTCINISGINAIRLQANNHRRRRTRARMGGRGRGGWVQDMSVQCGTGREEGEGEGGKGREGGGGKGGTIEAQTDIQRGSDERHAHPRLVLYRSLLERETTNRPPSPIRWSMTNNHSHPSFLFFPMTYRSEQYMTSLSTILIMLRSLTVLFLLRNGISHSHKDGKMKTRLMV